MDWRFFIVGLLASGVRLGSVLGLASIGETFCQRAGVLSLGLEGYMTMGTVTAFAVSMYTGNAWIGILAAMAMGLVLSLIHGALCVSMGVNQMVAGIAMVFFGAGLMSVIDARIFEGLGGVSDRGASRALAPSLVLAESPSSGTSFSTIRF